MTELMQHILAGKRAARRELAGLPVGEKFRLLEAMLDRERLIATSRPPKPANPVRIARIETN